jgi:hypothetical protein
MDAELARAFEDTTAIIRASEEWAHEYKDDPDTFNALLETESAIQRKFLSYLKELSERAPSFVAWGLYQQELLRRQNIQADATQDGFSVDVLIDDNQIGLEDTIVMQLLFDDVKKLVQIGSKAARTVYEKELDPGTLATTIEQTARDSIAQLVGKRINPDGTIVDNPDAYYRISDATRAAIRESIATSISLGEDQAAASKRLSDTLKNDTNRAELVAQTEAVNGYQQGMYSTAKATGAIGKESTYLGPTRKYNRKTKSYKVGKPDICGENAAQGAIPINRPFISGHQAPAYHPRCRCSVRYLYENEKDKINTTPTAKAVPKPKQEKDGGHGITVEHNGKSHTFALSDGEANFIKDNGVKVAVDSAGRLKGGVQAVYSNFLNQITVKKPGAKTGGLSYEHTFYHELGHAIDYEHNKVVKLRTLHAHALTADKTAILFGRLMSQGGVPEELAKQYSKGILRATMEVNGITKTYSMAPSFYRYASSAEELFADGYAQWRANPKAFEKAAPQIAAVYKELF